MISCSPKRAVSGFTLIELLTVVAILGILIALLLPSISKARDRAGAAQCLNNVRQITLGWTVYCQDNGEKLPPNVDGKFGGLTNWVAGYMSDPAEATNTRLLVDKNRSLIGAYLKTPALFKCPEDESSHVRSVSMNCRLNPTRENGVPPRWIGGAGMQYRTFSALNEIQAPDRIFSILDENPESINDAYFAVDMSNTGTPEGNGSPEPYYLIDYPGSNHSGTASISFVDGHAELHRWTEQSTLSGISAQKHVPPPNTDAAWLQDHCTYR